MTINVAHQLPFGYQQGYFKHACSSNIGHRNIKINEQVIEVRKRDIYEKKSLYIIVMQISEFGATIYNKRYWQCTLVTHASYFQGKSCQLKS